MTDVYPQALIGYRQWWIDEKDRLMPFAAAGPPWVPGINRASCYDQVLLEEMWPNFDKFSEKRVNRAIKKEHQAPDPGCDCGIYAYNRLDLQSYDCSFLTSIAKKLYLNGSIAARGHVQLHTDGFRAEEAQILALYLEPGQQQYREQAQRVAEQYNLKLFTKCADWQAFSVELGSSATGLF